ncbi:inositol monophosphatase family protein [Pseudaminobacter soli (ex Li et al. 2025)]|uniref:Inositol-1-monophosphatase n=1 Tax=Pseudaminobacter soli (ex Li et al. 2025) TaxID=1295366 RepID=A0A2P7SNW5_9HYPH|nr:inositol monophosphatase family protein [Mesorhizobium soli]PSJ64186.1 inositol monophosphatase [Mesorhizobium soli]
MTPRLVADTGTTNDDPLARRFAFALSMAREAGRLAMRYFRSRDLSISQKGLRDLVTAADHAVDALIRTKIAENFPEDGILTEETAGAISGTTWVIDPIDGTGNFARGIACFAISIAVCVDGVTQIGVVFDPAADEMFAARRGRGAFCNGTPLGVSKTTQLAEATVDAGYSRKAPLPDYVALLARLLDAGCDFVQFGSAARGLAHVAAGRVDGFIEAHLFAWDVLAGLLLVQEASGFSTDFLLTGNWESGQPVLACTPGLSAALTEIA